VTVKEQKSGHPDRDEGRKFAVSSAQAVDISADGFKIELRGLSQHRWRDFFCTKCQIYGTHGFFVLGLTRHGISGRSERNTGEKCHATFV
jgi:hypothetical protein